MGVRAPISSTFSDFHRELVRHERLTYNDVWQRLGRAIRSGSAEPMIEFDTIGFAFDRNDEMFSVFATFEDGSDKVALTRKDFVRELKKYSRGAGND